MPGDVVLLDAGDLVPADGIVIEANAAQVKQAALTGSPYSSGLPLGIPGSESRVAIPERRGTAP